MQKAFHPLHLDQAIDHAIATKKVTGASIVVAKVGEVLFEKHTGWADREAQKPVTYGLQEFQKNVTAALYKDLR